MKTSPHQSSQPTDRDGKAWNDAITRRSFLKRSGGATAATMILWHLSSNNSLGAVNHECVGDSADAEWTGYGDQIRRLSDHAAALGNAVGNDLANEVIGFAQHTGLANALTLIWGSSGWQASLRGACKSAAIQVFIVKTEELVWSYRGGAKERTLCNHLNEPTCSKSTGEIETDIEISVGINDKLKIGIGGKCKIDLLPEDAVNFGSSSSGITQIPTPSQRAKVAVDTKITFSMTDIVETPFGSFRATISGEAESTDAVVEVSK